MKVIKRIFGSLGYGWRHLEKKIGSKNKTLGKMAKNGSLRFFGLSLLVVAIGGAAYGFSKINYRDVAKITLNADAGCTGLFCTNKLNSTITTFFPFNGITPPDGMFDSPLDPLYISDNNARIAAQTAEWQFEASHYDSGIASLHLKGIKDTAQTEHTAIPQLTKYILFTSPGSNIDDTRPEADVNQMQTYCTSHSLPFEDAFMHFSDDTTLITGRVIKGWGQGTAASRTEARILRWDDGAKPQAYFYAYNLNSPCFREYMADMIHKIMTQGQNGIDEHGYAFEGGYTYDGVFIDEMMGGGLATFTKTFYSDNPNNPDDSATAYNHGGKITEFGNLHLTDPNHSAEFGDNHMFDEYNVIRRDALRAVKDSVKSKISGRDFLMLPNTGDSSGWNEVVTASGANGALTEAFDRDQYKDRAGEKRRWEYAKSVTDAGGYFVWSVDVNDVDMGVLSGINAGNYAGAKGIYRVHHYPGITDDGDARFHFYDVKRDGSAAEARHDMFGISSYLIAMDKNNRTLLFDAGTPGSWGTPASATWIPAMDLDIGKPVVSPKKTYDTSSSDYFLWKTSIAQVDEYTSAIPINTTVDSVGQEVMIYRRDFDHAMVLMRTFAYGENMNYGIASPTYPLGGDYRVLFPDGTQGPVINQISLGMEEGVVLIPDGYDPMTGGVTPPPTTNAQITMSAGGTHNTGETFPVNIDLNTNGNKVCAAKLSVDFPKDKIAFESAALGPIYNINVSSSYVEDDDSGTITYNIGASGCSTANSTLLTINFRAAGRGSGSIDFPDVKVVGGEDSGNIADITTNTTGTSFTINGDPITAPETTLTITNGATKNANDWYTATPVLRLTAVPASGTTVANIKYRWENTADFTTVSAATVNDIAVSDGEHTITYYAADNLGNEEVPKTQTFKVDTSIPINPDVDPFNQMTYKTALTLHGTKEASVRDVWAKIFDINGDSSKTKADLSGNNWSKNINLFLKAETYTCIDPSTQLERDDCIRAKVTKVELTTANQAGVETLPLIVYITRHMLADMDGDMVVGVRDFIGIKANWLGVAPNINVMSDMNNNGNGDGTCDLYDFGTLLANWTEA